MFSACLITSQAASKIASSLRQRAQVEGRVRGVLWRHCLRRSDDAPGGGVVADAVDRLDRGELAVPEAEGCEGACLGIAAKNPLIDAVRQPRDLQLEIALVAPEPRQRFIGRGGLP